MNFQPEQIEQQRRSVAMLPPQSPASVVLRLVREDAMDVLAFASEITALRKREQAAP